MPLFEKDHPLAIIPTRATSGSAGYDLFPLRISDKDIEIPGYEYTMPTMIETGIKVNIPEGYCGQIWAKSSLGSLGISVFAGMIDSDYRKTIKVLLMNFDNDLFVVPDNKAIAQLVIVPIYTGDDVVGVVRVGGFGSTEASVKVPEVSAV